MYKTHSRTDHSWDELGFGPHNYKTNRQLYFMRTSFEHVQCMCIQEKLSVGTNLWNGNIKKWPIS